MSVRVKRWDFEGHEVYIAIDTIANGRSTQEAPRPRGYSTRAIFSSSTLIPGKNYGYVEDHTPPYCDPHFLERAKNDFLKALRGLPEMKEPKDYADPSRREYEGGTYMEREKWCPDSYDPPRRTPEFMVCEFDAEGEDRNCAAAVLLKEIEDMRDLLRNVHINASRSSPSNSSDSLDYKLQTIASLTREYADPSPAKRTLFERAKAFLTQRGTP